MSEDDVLNAMRAVLARPPFTRAMKFALMWLTSYRAEKSGSATVEQIANATGLSLNMARKSLRALVDSGDAVRLENGEYRSALP